MDTKKLEKWASLLLDTGKRNNLINFKDTKASTAEIVLPKISSIFEKAESEASFEVYDPEIADDNAEDYMNVPQDNEEEDKAISRKQKRERYINTYGPKIKKSNQILLYNENVNPITALKNIDKKSRAYMEETGVSVAYMAFGFIYWKESDNSKYVYRAPILLVPITFQNESSVSPWFIKMTEDDNIVDL